MASKSEMPVSIFLGLGRIMGFLLSPFFFKDSDCVINRLPAIEILIRSFPDVFLESQFESTTPDCIFNCGCVEKDIYSPMTALLLLKCNITDGSIK
jgi:hypothetical protein